MFLEYHDILGTLIHEITHNKISKHDSSFYKLMDELYDEVERNEMDPFSGESHVLGGNSMSLQGRSAKTLMREAALSRQQQSILFAGSGQKLGGRKEWHAKTPSPAELRRLALAAAEQRMRDQWCSNNIEAEVDSEDKFGTSGSNDIDELRNIIDISDADNESIGSAAASSADDSYAQAKRLRVLCNQCPPSSVRTAGIPKLCFCCSSASIESLVQERKVGDIIDLTDDHDLANSPSSSLAPAVLDPMSKPAASNKDSMNEIIDTYISEYECPRCTFVSTLIIDAVTLRPVSGRNNCEMCDYEIYPMIT